MNQSAQKASVVLAVALSAASAFGAENSGVEPASSVANTFESTAVPDLTPAQLQLLQDLMNRSVNSDLLLPPTETEVFDP